MDEDYKCTLSEACLKQAMSELSEDPKNRLSSVQTLREWIETQKHLNCRKGTNCSHGSTAAQVRCLASDSLQAAKALQN